VIGADLTYLPAAVGRDYTQTIHGWAYTSEQPGSTSAISFDFDFTADHVASTTSSGSFPIPAHEVGSFFATASALVFVYDYGHPNAPTVGLPASMAFAADERSASYTVSYAMLPGTSALATYYFMEGSAGIPSSLVIEPGTPAGGARPITFLAPPSVRLPADGSFSRATADVVVDNAVPGAILSVAIASGDITTYTAYAPSGGNTVRFPRLPTGADASVVFGGGLSQTIVLCTPQTDPTIGAYCAQRSATEISVDPP
jgi:hypothetical protein